MKNLFLSIDERLNARALKSFSKIKESPGLPLPSIFTKYADLEGFYRLMKNDRLKSSDMIKEIGRDNIEKLSEIKSDDELVVIHDTTFINPKLNLKKKALGERGLGTHVSLLASGGPSSAIYGVVNTTFFQRDKNGRKTIDGMESERWLESVLASEKRLGPNIPAIHLMDREGDIQELLCEMNLKGARYVVRASHNRCLEDGAEERLFSKMRSLNKKINLEANLSKREPHRLENIRTLYPARNSRMAKLSASSLSTVIVNENKHRNKYFPEECEVNIVRVWEENPPKGEPGVEWFLLTSEPIKTKKEIKRVIDLYRRRWLIEEFFKGLKTGCNIEKKQFECAETWKKLIIFYMPIAGKILNLRVLDQLCLNSLKFTLTDDQKKILEIHSKKKLESVTDYLYTLANLGGHIKYNGPPGWQTLFRGYEKLEIMAVAYKMRCDYL